MELVRLYEQGKNDRESKLHYVSLRSFDKAISLGRATGIPDFELKCLRQKSLTYWEMDQLDLFLLMNEHGLRISEAIHHDVERGRCLNNIGIAYHKQNEFSLAVEYLENALTCIRESGDTATEAECLSNIGILYRDLGNYSRALHYLTAALVIDRKTGDDESVSVDLGNIGTVFLKRGVATRDEQDLLQGMEALRGSLPPRGTAARELGSELTSINNIGIILNELGRHQEARAYFETALKATNGETSTLEKGHLLNNIAASYLYEDRVGEARRFYEMSYQLGVEKALEDVVIESSFGLGRCYELGRSYSEALDFYQQSASALENIRDRLSSEILTIGFERNRLGVYQNIIDILTSEYQSNPSQELFERIFDTVERAKARAFLENVRRANVDSTSADSLRVRERLKTLSRNIQELEKRLVGPDLPQAEKTLIDTELEHEEDEFLRLSFAIKEDRRDSRERTFRGVCSVQDIQRQVLDDKTMLLEYDLGEKHSTLLLISASVVEFFVLPGRAEIERSLRAYLKMVSERSIGRKDGHKASERIARDLLPFIGRKDLRGATKLIVIPDGILHYLPFETLRIVSASDVRYLVEDFALSYCPSASSLWALRNMQERGPRGKDLLAVGAPVYARRNDWSKEKASGEDEKGYSSYGDRTADLPSLPFSREEVLEVAKMFPKKRVQVLVGEAANEDAVKAVLLEEFRIIHLACHSLLDEAHPYRSALVLSLKNDRENDGFLQMREIYGLTTNADIVVLSACQTARGLLELAEGPMGLARPFFFTGARSVLASLWTVNDKAAVLFMREFYRHLRAGKAATDALRLAKLRFLKGSRDQPFYWAGFVLIGDHAVTASGQ
jgi:tetratricopeptide (TPR) repeat protein